MSQLNDLFLAMAKYEKHPPRIQHFTKVHAYAKWIGEAMALDEDTQFILETAALVHDIGIKPAIEKYGSGKGPYQEEQGPIYARPMLEELGFDEKVIDRVCYLVNHHHTYTGVDGLDYRILLEADALVNMEEGHMNEEQIQAFVKKVFETPAGLNLAHIIYHMED